MSSVLVERMRQVVVVVEAWDQVLMEREVLRKDWV